MAKQNSSAVANNQAPIPEACRPFIKLSEDGKSVFVTMRLDRYAEVLIRKSVTRKIDRCKIQPDRYPTTYLYGEGRKCRDGAETKDAKGKALSAKVAAGAKQLLDNAIAHCDARIEWLYGKREGKASSSGVSTVTRECRKLFVKYALKNLSDDKKKRYTPKSLPSALVAAKSLDAAKAEAKRIGVPKKKLDLLVKRAESIAALLDDDTDMSI